MVQGRIFSPNKTASVDNFLCVNHGWPKRRGLICAKCDLISLDSVPILFYVCLCEILVVGTIFNDLQVPLVVVLCVFAV